MRILVTGGAGYIGSHTCKLLAQEGLEPVVFDNFSTGHRWAVRWGPVIEADLADTDAIRGAIRAHDVEAVIHFAANAYVGESLKNPRKYFENNVANSLKLLDAVLDSGVNCFVLSSSCATYGIPRALSISEDHPQIPLSPYGESKLFCERVLRWYGEIHGLRWSALRYFNAAGADPDGELGELHEPETHLIPAAIEVALGNRPYLDVYGSDYATEDGSAVRDYVHVTDLADAHLKALRFLMAEGQDVALNLGTGHGYSVLEVIAAVEACARRKIAVRARPKRAGDSPALVADASRAAQLLGWRPKFPNLDAIVQTAWRWHAGRAAKAGSTITA